MWQEYPKIASGASGLGGGRYVCQEKLHGMNCSLRVVGDHVGVYKRRSELDASSITRVAGLAEILPVLSVQVRTLACALRESWGEGAPEDVTVYGELVGGAYPHPEVAPRGGVQAIQTGVWYSPEVVFVVFDAHVREGASSWWAGVDELAESVKHSGLQMVGERTRGSARQCVETAERACATGAETLLPRALGLPAIEGNAAEGCVVKPLERCKGERAVRKFKIETFSERRYAEARTPSVEVELAGVDAALASVLVGLLTPQRAVNAGSKWFNDARGGVGELEEELLEECSGRLAQLDARARARGEEVIRTAARSLWEHAMGTGAAGE